MSNTSTTASQREINFFRQLYRLPISAHVYIEDRVAKYNVLTTEANSKFKLPDKLIAADYSIPNRNLITPVRLAFLIPYSPTACHN
jgi:hypothetical protein